MADKLANLLINIDGQKHAKDLSISKTFDTETVGNGVYEQKFSVDSTDSPTSVSVSSAFGTLNKLICLSSSATELITLTLNIDNGVDAPYTRVIDFVEYMLINIGSDIMQYITSIDIANSSSSVIDIELRMYV